MRGASTKGALASVLAVLLTFGGIACTKPTSVGDAIPTVTAELTPRFVREVKAEGTLQAVKATAISPPAENRRGMRISWLAEDGATVEEGDVVIRLDAADIERELDDSRDDVRANQRRIDKVDVERGVSRSSRDATAALSELEVKTAREFENDDIDVFSRTEIAQSQIDIELAEAKADHARTVKEIEGKVSSSQLQLHRIARQQAKRSADRAEEALEKLEIRAPHPGVFILQRDWMGQRMKVGDTVWPGQRVAELPLVADLEAKLFVLEADAGALAAGVPADVFIAARPTERHGGKIKLVETLAQPRHPDVPVNYFGVTVTLDATDTATMRVGQRVEATLRVEAENAIVLPRQSVFEREGETVVFRRGSDGFEKVAVELGAASAGRVVIESGVAAGDEIALRDPTKNADELLLAKDSDEGKPAEAEGKSP